MGVQIFKDGDWDRIREGYVFLSDFHGLDRQMDRRLIEFLIRHMSDRHKEKTMRRFGISALPEEKEKADPLHPNFPLFLEQVRREDDYEVLREAALSGDDPDLSFLAFCRLTGFRRPPFAGEDDGYGFCGLKSDILREDIEDLCREMIGTGGPYECEAEQWLEYLAAVSDEALAAWTLPKTERRRRGIQAELRIRVLLQEEYPCDTLCGRDLEDAVRSIYDAYILMVYEERVKKLTRKEKRETVRAFTLKISEIMKHLRRDMITDAAEGIRAVLVTGKAMPPDMRMEDIRKIMLSETEGDPQHSRFLALAAQYGL